MFSYKANAICMAGMTMPAGAGVPASHCWNRVRKPGQLINYARFWPHRRTFAKNWTAHAQTNCRKSTQWQWASFVSVTGFDFLIEMSHNCFDSQCWFGYFQISSCIQLGGSDHYILKLVVHCQLGSVSGHTFWLFEMRLAIGPRKKLFGCTPLKGSQLDVFSP